MKHIILLIPHIRHPDIIQETLIRRLSAALREKSGFIQNHLIAVLTLFSAENPGVKLPDIRILII